MVDSTGQRFRGDPLDRLCRSDPWQARRAGRQLPNRLGPHHGGRDLVGKALDVEQVPRRDVVGCDIAAVAAATKRHRGIQTRCQPNRAVGGRRVDDDPVGRLLQTELQDDVIVTRVNGHRVAHPSVS